MSRKRPGLRFRLSWFFAVIATVLLSVILVISGLAGSGIVNDALGHDPVGDKAVPRSIVDGGTVVDVTRVPITSHAVPDRTIALTFDDGPDPRWTPEILATLKKHGIPATFFVVGSHASSHPDLVRAIRDSGSELGHHTFTHDNPVEMSPWQFEQELDQTRRAIAGAAGVRSYLFRPPFSSSASAIDDLGYRTVQAAAARGYLSVFTDTDSEDWERPGVDAIVRNSTPVNGAGAVVLMHDAGGDRSQTVAALDVLVPKLKAQGYRFSTVTGAVGLPPANQSASTADKVTGTVLVGMVTVSLAVVEVLRWILLVVGILVVARLVLMVGVARRHARIRRLPGRTWGPPVTEPVTVIVPAYNERANIEVSIRSILANDHPLEVVVVDDGSSDGTADLVESLRLPRVRVIRQANGGKATALNTGIAHAAYDIVVMVDGDTIFEQETVSRLVQPFGKPAIGAVAGNVKIANRDTFLTRLQHIEYVVGFNIDRRVHDLTGSMPTIPGAAGAFRRSALIDVGRVSQQTLAEDTDLTIALGRAGWRMVFVDDAIAWTEAPTSVRQLWQQRFRWTYGTMQAVWKHRRAVVQRGAAGRMGRFGLLPVIAFQIVLPVTAPLIDVFLIYGLFFLNPGMTLVLWLSVLGIQTAGAAYAFRLDREPLSPLWLMPAQQLVYRQLMYVVLGQSIAAALSGIRVRWQRMRRLGSLEAMAERTSALRAAAGEPPRPTAEPAPPADTGAPDRGPVGDRWPDLLLACALVSIVGYDLTGATWLSVGFPGSALMVALAGSRFVRALRDTPLIDVAGRGLRRLVFPLWAFGLILVPSMLVSGWAADDYPYALDLPSLIFWVFPVMEPPGSAWAADATSVLWLVRTVVWLLLLSPFLLWAFRRRPVVTALAPIALLAVDTALGSPLSATGPIGESVLDVLIFGGCWILGFAHGQSLLRTGRPVLVLGASALAVGLGVWWTVTEFVPGQRFDVADHPLGQALIGAGAVLVLLYAAPSLSWFDRMRGVRRAIGLVTGRVVTIYLWHNLAIGLAVAAADRFGWTSGAANALTSVALIVVAAALFGWVEDVVAGRRPRLLPAARPRLSQPERRHQENAEVDAADTRDSGGRAGIRSSSELG